MGPKQSEADLWFLVPWARFSECAPTYFSLCRFALFLLSPPSLVPPPLVPSLPWAAAPVACPSIRHCKQYIMVSPLSPALSSVSLFVLASCTHPYVSTDSVSGKVNVISRVRCPSVCFFPLYLLNELTFDLDVLHVHGSWQQLTGDWRSRSLQKCYNSAFHPFWVDKWVVGCN